MYYSNSGNEGRFIRVSLEITILDVRFYKGIMLPIDPLPPRAQIALGKKTWADIDMGTLRWKCEGRNTGDDPRWAAECHFTTGDRKKDWVILRNETAWLGGVYVHYEDEPRVAQLLANYGEPTGEEVAAL